MDRQEVYTALAQLMVGVTNNAPIDRLPAAYEAVDSERAYQNKCWGHTRSSNRPGAGERTVYEFGLYIDGYASDAAQIASHFGEPEKKLDVIRKIAGLCVACLEQHGTRFTTGVGLTEMPASIDEFVLAIVGRSRALTQSAFSARQNTRNRFEALVSIMEIGALCIECMAVHGAPLRQ